MIENSLESASQDEPDIEAMILAAGDYVQPTRDLRPRVLDALEEQETDQQVQRNLQRVLLVAGLLMVLAVPATRLLSGLPFPRSPSTAEIEQRVELRSQQPTTNFNWLFVDLFTEMRGKPVDSNRTVLDN